MESNSNNNSNISTSESRAASGYQHNSLGEAQQRFNELEIKLNNTSNNTSIKTPISTPESSSEPILEHNDTTNDKVEASDVNRASKGVLDNDLDNVLDNVLEEGNFGDMVVSVTKDTTTFEIDNVTQEVYNSHIENHPLGSNLTHIKNEVDAHVDAFYDDGNPNHSPVIASFANATNDAELNISMSRMLQAELGEYYKFDNDKSSTAIWTDVKQLAKEQLSNDDRKRFNKMMNKGGVQAYIAANTLIELIKQNLK